MVMPCLADLPLSKVETVCADKLINGLSLPEKYRDHALKGDLKDFRDCHIKPDLVLIYTVSDEFVHLIRIGSHSELDIA